MHSKLCRVQASCALETDCSAAQLPSMQGLRHGRRPLSWHAPQHHAGEVLLLGGVPLAGDQQREALAGVGDEACRWEARCGGWGARREACARPAIGQLRRAQTRRCAPSLHPPDLLVILPANTRAASP